MAFAAKDIPEIVAALTDFVAAPEPYTIGFDPPLDLRPIAAELRLLPAMLDMGGCLGLRPDGEVASFLWDDEPFALRPETDARIRNIAYLWASLKYPELARLVPSRPARAVVCSHCGGSGRLLGLSESLASRVVCYCGGLGWLPSPDADPSGASTPTVASPASV